MSILIVIIICWIAHFWNFRKFGLYEDDYALVSPVLGMTAGQVVKLALAQNLASAQGHPLCYVLIFFFTFVGAKLGGLPMVYVIGFLIFCVNIILFLLLLQRLSSSSVAGSLMFVLFPSDTTRSFLSYALGVQPAVTLLLLATLAYLSQRKILSYVLISLSLLVYETVFPVFVCAPLLASKWDSKGLKQTIVHAVVLSVILMCAFVSRWSTGESRVREMDVPAMIVHSCKQMVRGPLTTLVTMVRRPLDTIRSLNTEVAVLSVLCFALVWSFGPTDLEGSRQHGAANLQAATKFAWAAHGPPVRIAKLAFSAIAMMVTAYPLTLTVRAAEIDGRSSRVHLAAAPGTSLLFAVVFAVLVWSGNSAGVGRVLALCGAAFFGLLVGFGVIVQQDYVSAAKYERNFWTDVVRLCPDIEDGDVILVERTGLKSVPQIEAHGWSVPLVLSQIYRFPPSWSFVPRVYLLPPNWPQEAIIGGRIWLERIGPLPWIPDTLRLVGNQHILYLRSAEGRLERSSEAYGMTFKKAGSMHSFSRGHLYGLLVEDGR